MTPRAENYTVRGAACVFSKTGVGCECPPCPAVPTRCSCFDNPFQSTPHPMKGSMPRSGSHARLSFGILLALVLSIITSYAQELASLRASAASGDDEAQSQ